MALSCKAHTTGAKHGIVERSQGDVQLAFGDQHHLAVVAVGQRRVVVDLKGQALVGPKPGQPRLASSLALHVVCVGRRLLWRRLVCAEAGEHGAT